MARSLKRSFMSAAIALLAGLAVFAGGVATARAFTVPVLSAPTTLQVNAAATYSASVVANSNEIVTQVLYTFPRNTDVTSATVALTLGGVPIVPDSVTTSTVGDTVTIALNVTASGSSSDRVLAASVGQIVGPSEPGAYSYTVQFSGLRNGNPDTSAASLGYTIVANTTAPTLGAVMAAFPRPGATTTLTVPVTVGLQGRLASDSEPGLVVTPNRIFLTFPVAFTLPASVPANSITIDGSVVTTASVTGQTLTLSIPDGVTIPNGDTAAIVIKPAFGMANPAVGSYTLSAATTAETGTATSPAFSISPYPVAAIVAPTNFAVLGGSFAVVSGTAFDSGPGLAEVELMIQRSDGSYWDGVSGWTLTPTAFPANNTASWSYTWLLPADDRVFTYSISAQAVATDGATSTVSSVGGLIVDSVPPSGTITIDAGASYTSTTSVALALAATDGGTVTDLRFSDDGSSWSAWEAYATTRSYTLPAGDGPKTVYVQYRDASANISAAASDSITLDTTAPTVLIGGVTDGGIYNATVSPTFSAIDPNLGSVDATLDGAAFASGSSVTSAGVHVLSVRAVDMAGNVATRGASFTIDLLPPVTTATGIPAGWSSTDVTVTLSATDDISGVAHSFLAVNGGAATTYTAPVPFSAEGTTTVGYWSTDVAGNVEPETTATIRIDTSAPSTPDTPTATPSSTCTIDVHWPAAADAVSGIAYYEVLVDHSVATTSGSTSAPVSGLATETAYAVSVRAVDRAGNRSTESSAVTVVTLAQTARPSYGIYARAVGASGVYIDWVEATGTVPPVVYNVWRSVAGGLYSRVATVAAGGNLAFSDADAPLFEQLEYAVSVTDARGNGQLSAPTALTSTVSTDLPAPVTITPRNTNSVTVTWTPVAEPNVAGYHVYRSTSSTGTPETQTVTPVVTPSYHDTTVADYTEYWYRIATVDTSGNVGPLSRPAYIRTETSSTAGEPHGGYTQDTDFCALCHVVHTSASGATLAQSPGSEASPTVSALLTGTSSIDAPLCLSCHDGTSASDVLSEYDDMTRSSRHSVTVGAAPGTMVCSSCHAVHSKAASDTVAGLLSSKGKKSGNPFCYSCHGSTAGTLPRGDLTGFQNSAHEASITPPASGTGVVCQRCHVGHSTREAGLYPYSGDDRCLRCHEGGTPGSPTGIGERLSGPGPDTRHDLLTADSQATGSRLSCANCHEPHTSSATTPCVNPNNPTTTSGMATGDTLCLTCHDGTLPTSVDTSGWASAPLAAGGSTTVTDIAAAWTNNVHGAATSVAPSLKPGMGYAQGDALTCATCHDSHGSPNRFMLMDSVPSKSGTATADSLLVVPVGANGADMRFFCAACHDVSAATHPGPSEGGADLNLFPIDCTASGCHTHVGSGL